MKDPFNNMDQAFRDRFSDFEATPPDHVWENVKQEIPTRTSPDGSGFHSSKFGFIGLSVIALMAGIFSVYLLLNNDAENTLVAEPEPAEQHNNDSNLDNNVTSSDIVSSLEPAPFENVRTETAAISKSKFTPAKERPSAKLDRIEARPLTKTLMTQKVENTLLASKMLSFTNSESAQDDNILAYNDAEIGMTARELNNPVRDLKLNSAGQPTPSPAASPPMGNLELKDRLLLGLYFTPEAIFYPDDPVYGKYDYSIDLNAIYLMSDLFIQTGLGITSSKDNGQCHVDYNEYLGSYEDVYYVDFDSLGNPTYHSSTVHVYDTTSSYKIEPSVDRYFYVRIPLYFGYYKELRRVSMNIKAGPSLSMLISENRPEFDYAPTEMKILKIDREAPKRIKTNWHFVISAGINYRISNHLSLGVEPTFRYYIQPAYERSSLKTKHPYAVGLRTGVIFNF